MDTRSRRIVIDINGMPTAIIPRGENQPPIILYTLPPPPYYKHAEFELIDMGPPIPPPQVVNNDDDDVCDLFWFKCLIMFAILTVIVIGTMLILINW